MNTVNSQLKKLNLTEATRFVLPMLYSKDRNANFFITKNFENCYIGNGLHPELGYKIYLVYNYQMTVEYVKFERKIELMSEFITDFDYSSERQVIYVFGIPEQFNADFQYFLNGEYSKFSEELKENIVTFWDIKDKTSIFYGTIYANDTIKEKALDLDNDNYAPGEYWPKPVLSREIYMNPS